MEPGTAIGHYRIIRQLGKGGMGEVYLAEDTSLKREVAIKVLPASVQDDPERLRRFRREAEAAAKLNHLNIATIYSIEEADGQTFITMEYVEGKPLSAHIPSDGMDLDTFFSTFIPLADALAHAHGHGRIHRDLKPGNINISKKEVIIKGGKGGVDRNLSFSDYTGELLKKYKEARPKGDYFFCTLEGKKLDRVYLYAMIRRYAKRIGITKKIGLHTLRHSFALKFYQDSGHDLIRLQKILGHKSLVTTQVYCYIDSTDVKEGLEAYYTKRDFKDKNLEGRIKDLERQIQDLKADTGTG